MYLVWLVYFLAVYWLVQDSDEYRAMDVKRKVFWWLGCTIFQHWLYWVFVPLIALFGGRRRAYFLVHFTWICGFFWSCIYAAFLLYVLLW